MRLGILLAAAFLVVAVAVIRGDGDRNEPALEFSLELDNAFGVERGSDVRIAGTRAGSVVKTEIDFQRRRPVVWFRMDRDDFGGLRADVRCGVHLQSLIGEYFVDCDPGVAPSRLPDGARIPVTRTTATIPLDLINNIQRLPRRQRAAIIIREFGAAAAGNGENLNAALRRFNPALEATDRVLAQLATERRTIAQMTSNARGVTDALARNRRNIGRWVDEVGNWSATVAERRADLAVGLRRLPGFVEQIGPTMAALGAAARRSTPTVAKLGASAGDLGTFLRRTEAFADAGRPALRALGRAADAGDPAVRNLKQLVPTLARFAEQTPETAKDLAIILEHLDSREHAVERDDSSPGGAGFTGLEAVLQWVHNLTLTINTYTRTGYFVKSSDFFQTTCSTYADAKVGKRLASQCGQFLGPTQPGVLTPDPTAVDPAPTRTSRPRSSHPVFGPLAPVGVAPTAPPNARIAPPAPERPPGVLPTPVPDLPLPDLPLPFPAELPSSRSLAALDYLLGP